VNIPLTIALVGAWGITGAAVAWTTRCASDLVLYEWVSRRAIGRYSVDAGERVQITWLWLTGVGLAAVMAGSIWLGGWSRLAAMIAVFVGLAVYTALGWERVLSPDERHAWAAMLFPNARPGSAR
jgi:hypothetical protein